MSRRFIIPLVATLGCALWFGLYRSRVTPVVPEVSRTGSAPVATREIPTATSHAADEHSSGTTKAYAPIATPQREEPELSREEAKAWLKLAVIQIDTSDERLPELDLRPEDSATEDERAQILRARQWAQENGFLLIIARMPDRTLYFHQTTGEFPREFFPAHVRKNLTEEDWEIFQVEMAVATFRKDVARRLKRKTPTTTRGLTTP